MSVLDVFAECDRAVRHGVPIQRPSEKDKEYHFQHWFEHRLQALGLGYEPPKRNTYPDFRMVAAPIGYELKGLNHPGRISNFDCNSKLCAGFHDGRTIYYVFGRYPKGGGDSYPVIDLVIFHGSFLNPRLGYVHANKSFRGFGSYGDIMIRDRKMYVAPTPFGLLDGIDRQVTLILKSDEVVDDRFRPVGEIERAETQKVVTKYAFDLTTNELVTSEGDNPTAGTKHHFRAYRVVGAPGVEVKMKPVPILPTDEDADHVDEVAELKEKKVRKRSQKSGGSKPKQPPRKRS
jgi:hypothetical protein